MVYILLAPGFEEAEALVPADLLRRAGLDVALTSLEGPLVPGGHGIIVQADLTLDQVALDRAQMILLPGGGVGVKNLGEDPRVETLVRSAVEQHIPLAAICAAPSLLGLWGLLEGKHAVCYPGWEDKLTGATVDREAPVVEDGDILTGKAAGTAYEFGLALVKRLAGGEKEEEIRRGICYR